MLKGSGLAKAHYQDCIAWKPDIIGITIMELSHDSALEIASVLRKKCNAVYIAGGSSVALHKEAFLQDNPVFDHAIYGEGEETTADLLEALSGRKQLKDIAGLIYRDGGNIRLNPPRPLLIVDVLPYPDVAIQKAKHYYYPILSSRGCPYSCVFCMNGIVWDKKWRGRSVENVIAEIRFVVEKSGCRNFSIVDDNFTLDLERAKGILRRIIAGGFNIQFALGNGIRADRIDEELVSLLRDAGCCRVAIGVENGDPATFDYVRKGESLDDIEKAVKLIKRHGIPVEAFMIIGLIGTDKDSVYRSMGFIRKLDIPARWYIAMPFAGTPLYDWVQTNGRFFQEVDCRHGTWSAKPPVFFETDRFPKAEMIRMHRIANIDSKNYFFLMSGNTLVGRVISGFYRVLRYRPTRIFDYMGFLIRCIVDPYKAIFNLKV